MGTIRISFSLYSFLLIYLFFPTHLHLLSSLLFAKVGSVMLPVPIILKLVALGVAKKGIVYGIARV